MKQILPVFLFLLLALSIRADQIIDPQIESDIQALTKATETGDARTILNMTYSPLIAAMGGDEQAYMKLNSAIVALRLKSVKVTHYEAVKPYTKASGEDCDYVFIPTRMNMSIGPHDFEEESYILAVKFHDSTKWQYVSGSSNLSQQRDGLFPDLPKSIPLPDIRRIRID